MNINMFRMANPADAIAIVALVNGAYRPQLNVSGWTHESDWVEGERTNTTQVMEMMAKPEAVILLGFDGADMVACVHVEKVGEQSHIGMLAVNPLLQGSGAGKQMLAHAEDYAMRVFGAQKFVMVVLSVRTALMSFYCRRGYQPAGAVMDYPIAAGVGTPKVAGLTIEVLEKHSSIRHPSAVL